MAQLTDLTPSSMDASMHSDTSKAGSGMVNSPHIVALIAPSIPSLASLVVMSQPNSSPCSMYSSIS